jgi:hypothetical protein
MNWSLHSSPNPTRITVRHTREAIRTMWLRTSEHDHTAVRRDGVAGSVSFGTSFGITKYGIARLPLVVRTTADIRTLRDNARATRRLPREGIQVVIHGLNRDETRRIEKRICQYVQACGCAQGGATALIATMLVLTSLAWRMSVRGPHWSDFGAAAVGLILIVLVGGLGKTIGLLIARLRFERWCNNVIKTIDSR